MSDVRFLYVRDENRFPLGCFAYQANSITKNGVVTNKRLLYGYSVYNPQDIFNKRIARLVAEYRLSLDPHAVYGSSQTRTNDLVLDMLKTTNKSEVHQWAEPQYKILSVRFRKACEKMAEHFLEIKKDKEMKLDNSCDFSKCEVA